MILQNKIEIDILDFVKTGRFDYLKIGQTKEWILNNFPDPDDIGIGSTVNDAKIWFYGTIELHFEEDKLCLIHSGNISEINGGSSLEIKKSFFSDLQNLTLNEFIKELNTEGIDFAKKTERFGLEYVRLIIQGSNVQFTFVDEENLVMNQNYLRFSSFSLK